MISFFKKIIWNFLPDKVCLKRIFYHKLGYRLNIKNPKTFNEKIQRLKLYNRNPDYTKMVNKYLVKEYVSKIIGNKYIIPTLGIYNRFDDIDFKKLPNKFVIKCTHDSGSIIICHNKKTFNKKKAKEKIEERLKFNYYKYCKERAYKDIKPQIIIEKYMLDKGKNELLDYKFMCFNGKVKCSFVCSERFHDKLKVTFFDKDWNKMPFERHYPQSTKEIEKPKNYEHMVKIAEKLANNIPFVRIDLYEINQKIYFGEFTFYPGNGFEEFSPIKRDFILGNRIELPKKIYE